MSEFKTYRVRYCEWQTFAINVGARNEDEACALARNIRNEIGQMPFQELDGGSEGFEAEEISGADRPAEKGSRTRAKSRPSAPSAKTRVK